MVKIIYDYNYNNTLSSKKWGKKPKINKNLIDNQDINYKKILTIFNYIIKYTKLIN